MLNIFKRFNRAQEGVAATEFAFIAPVLLFLLLGVIEFSNYSMISRRAEMATNLTAEYLSRDDDNRLDWYEMWVAEAIPAFTNPTADIDTGDTGPVWVGSLSVSFASVEFDREDPECQGVNCAYEPTVLFNTLTEWRHDDLVRNECEMQLVSNNAEIDGTKLPEGFAGRGALVRADTVYVYQPLLENGYLPEFSFYVNAIRKTRSGLALKSDRNADDYWFDLCDD